MHTLHDHRQAVRVDVCLPIPASYFQNRLNMVVLEFHECYLGLHAHFDFHETDPKTFRHGVVNKVEVKVEVNS